MSIKIDSLKNIIGMITDISRHSSGVDVVPQFLKVSQTIKELLKNADGQFMALCNDSQSLYQNIEELRAGINNAAGIIDMSNDQSSFNTLESNAQKTLNAFQLVNENIGVSVDAISSLKNEIEQLLSQCEKFRDSSHYLKIVRTNISMESVRTDRARELFATLADEIQNLSDGITEISSNMTDDLELARLRQIEAENVIRDGLGNILSLHQKADKEIKVATEKARELVDISNQWLSEVADHFKIISKHVSDIVISMQFHDIVRQRLEHVTEALDEIVEKISSSGNNKKTMAYAYQIAALQAAQLGHVYSDVDNAYQRIKDAFSNISERLNRFDSGSASNSESSSRNNAFKNLIEELYQFNEFVGHATNLSGQTSQTIDMVHQTTISLTSYIRDIRKISRELSLKALNAIVLTERLGQDGKTLAVLTEEVYGRAGISQNLGLEVTGVLDKIKQLSEQMTVENSEQNLESDLANLKDNISTIDFAYKEYENASQKTNSEIINIEKEVDRVIRYAAFMENMLNSLRQQEDILTECENSLERYKKYTDSELDEEIRKIHESYTMDSERLVHNKAFGSNDTKNDAADDFGSIDLFDDPGDELVASSTDSDDDLGDNVELF